MSLKGQEGGSEFSLGAEDSQFIRRTEGRLVG